MRSSIALFGGGLLVVLAGCKQSEAAPAERQQLFANACARCHGQNGTGGVPTYEGGPAPRNFSDHEFQRSRTDEQLKMTIRDGKGSGMPAFGNTFDDAQLAALVAQIRSFDPKGGK
ncbi:MAG TPA: cytochrome c [Labilithrix sp.]|nr:cytochrome c [Labilithrix sp.]